MFFSLLFVVVCFISLSSFLLYNYTKDVGVFECLKL